MLQSWLGEETSTAIRVLDEATVSQVREAVRDAGHRQGLNKERLERLASAASELAHNQRLHAAGGLVVVRDCVRGEVKGVEVVAADRGPGVADPRAALNGLASITSDSLGVGLSAARRMSDEMDVDVRMGEGSCFWLRTFAEPVARGHEVAIWGQPKDGERVSGDDAVFVRAEGALLVMIGDGLGHGQLAREASARAAALVRKRYRDGLDGMIGACDSELARTRGAAITLARLQDGAPTIECACVGNVACAIEERGSSRKFAGENWTVGVPSMRRKVRIERLPFERGATLIVHSDGISGRATLSGQANLRLEHPVVAAHFLATTFGRGTDDVTVAIVR